MNIKQRAYHIRNIIINFFKSNTRNNDFMAYTANHYEELYDLLEPNNFNTSEKAIANGMYLCGRKAEYQSIKNQAKLADKYDKEHKN